MDLTPYVATLRHELAVATEAGDEGARALAERLAATLEAATRLALLNALSDATREITLELAPGSVDVRLRGLDPDFVVTAPPGGEPFAERPDRSASARLTAAPVPRPAAEPEDGGASRINLRLPARLKLRAEQATAAEGVSLNSWLVRAVSDALEPDGNRGSVALT